MLNGLTIFEQYYCKEENSDAYNLNNALQLQSTIKLLKICGIVTFFRFGTAIGTINTENQRKKDILLAEFKQYAPVGLILKKMMDYHRKRIVVA